MTHIPHASHWGAFSAEVRDGRIIASHPFVHDPEPSPIIHGTADAVHAANRIDRPYARKAWLEGDRDGGTLRGGDAFVALDWDVATRLVAEELRRVTNTWWPSVFGGSYGWSSAGRFHHAKTQVQRLLSAAGGFTTSLTSYSHGAAQVLLPHVMGDIACCVGPVTDRARSAAIRS